MIAHICNDVGAWGKGFVLAISRRWKKPASEFKAWYAGSGDCPFELGQVQFVAVGDDLWVANMIGQHGLGARAGVIPLRYDALRDSLVKVAQFSAEHGASVHMPRIGCGLAGGAWDRVEPIIAECLLSQGISVYVYDYEPGG